MRATSRARLRIIGGILGVLAAGTFGCADSSWNGTLKENTVASYNKFLRNHPTSAKADEARERIAYLRVSAAPRIAKYEEFAATYPQSVYTAELRRQVEPQYFDQARGMNTKVAYQGFLQRYPNEALTSRARGNLEYITHVRDNPESGRLQKFVGQFPESDFAGEAQNTLELLDYRIETDIRKLGVRVDVAPNVRQPERVRRGFAAVVAREYQDQGIEVQLIPVGEEVPADIDAWMRIDYHEAPASGTFGGRTLLSQCRIRLFHKNSDEPVWDRRFEAPADHVIQGAYGRDKTVFANSTYRFWSEFFVPVSTWAASGVLVHRQELPEDLAAIDVRGDRAAMLYVRGGIDYLDVSSPLEPTVLERYRRERDLSRWTGVKVISDTLIASYGPDGLEVVELGEVQARRIGRWELPEVGSVKATALYNHPLGRTLLFASSKGVFAIRLDNRPLRANRLLDGEFVGVHIVEPYIYLVQPNLVEVTTPKHLLQHLTGPKLVLRKNFGAKRARVGGSSLYVFGKDEVVEVSLSTPGRPKLMVSLPVETFGTLSDLESDGNHLYLLGSHGLGVTNSSAQWVLDHIQVDANTSLSRKGRFLLLIGGRTLEVVDLAPYQVAVASPQQ